MTRTVAAADLGLPVLHHDALGCSRALAAVVAAASRPAPVDPDAELLALGPEMDRLHATMRALAAVNDATAVGSNESREADAAFLIAFDAEHEVLKKIASLRATTYAGLGVQGRALAYVLRSEYEDEIVAGSADATDCRLMRAILAGPVQDRPTASSVTAAAITAEHPDAELLDLGRRWTVLFQDWSQADRDEPTMTSEEEGERIGALIDRETWLDEAITAQPAYTPAGLAVKARALARAFDDGARDHVDLTTWATGAACKKDDLGRAVGSLIVDLLRLAAEPVR